MNKAKENILLHPVRLRIIMAAASRQVTAQQLANELPDIPQATLYRNIKALAGAGILSVVRERRVRNTLEKTYALAEEGLFLTPEDLKNARPEDYIRLFTQYLGQLLGYYARYIQAGNVDIVRDHLAFEMFPVFLSETEVQSLGQALNAALRPYLKNGPSPERRRSVLGLMAIPDFVVGPLSPDAPAVEAAEARKE